MKDKVVRVFLFNIEFTFNLASVLAFVAGVLSGMILIVLIYVLWVLIYLKKQEVILHSQNDKVDPRLVKEEIAKAEKRFLIERKENRSVEFSAFKGICLDLIEGIASLYYPESPHPIGELTVKELMLLDEYLLEKLDDLLNKVTLRPLKKVKINQLLSLLNMKRTLDSNPVVQTTKHITDFSGKLLSVVHFVNPVVWIKRGIVNPSIRLIGKKICLIAIATIGQETYHIYSKQAFLAPLTDEDIEKLAEILRAPQENVQDKIRA